MSKKILDAGELDDIVADVVERVRQRAIWPLHVHVIMNGAFMFAADFLRQYNHGKIDDVSFPLIRRGYSTGSIHSPRLLKSTTPTISWKKLRSHVILDVIVEEGKTLWHYLDFFPRVVRPAVIPVALLQKGNTRLPTSWIIGKRMEGVGFLYGYGMGPWRDWGAVYEVEPNEVLAIG